MYYLDMNFLPHYLQSFVDLSSMLMVVLNPSRSENNAHHSSGIYRRSHRIYTIFDQQGLLSD